MGTPYRQTARNTLKLYAARTMRNLAFNRYRDARAERRGGGQPCAPLKELSECISEQSVDEALNRWELNRIIQTFLAGLHTQKRNIFIRRYYYADDISEDTRAPVWTRHGKSHLCCAVQSQKAVEKGAGRGGLRCMRRNELLFDAIGSIECFSACKNGRKGT